ncbi:hypothetical protein B0H67DRAFT_478295 [Lasiosphaeris hirsuta]|uniref:Uncharacterized protein n=1 Tax=Lasiosphaeris hirsuta TaxID=260670 RepID=A0AA40BAF6_9PEZI|nr:hypothetical protein B0H67DRAFT_478295 [Lasiosphaeris hirsuta]
MEILVHVAAPAKAADDVAYRALARAYLEFESTSRISVDLDQPLTHDVSVAETSYAGNSLWQAGSGTIPSSSMNRGVVDSPEISFQSVFGNCDSPRLRQVHDEHTQNSQSSFVAPPSIIQDSLPENNLAISQYCSPTRILEHYLSAFDCSQLDSPPGFQRGALPIDDHSSEWQSPPYQQHTQSGGTVIPLSPVAENKRRRRHSTSQPSQIEETRIASSYPSQLPESLIGEVIPSSIPRADSEPPTKRPRCSPAPVPGNSLARSSSDIGPRQDRNNTQQGITQPPDHLQTLDHLKVVAPDPPVSLQTLQPKDVITDTVAKLARQLGLEERFQPQSQSRPLRPFERGYWLIDCSAWTDNLKQSAWVFITKYVESGRTGWGVSCTRDKDFTRIRFYCFGCVVGHMYLVIYLMSQRKILEVGMSWIAADGKPVLVMAPKLHKVKDGTSSSRG